MKFSFLSFFIIGIISCKGVIDFNSEKDLLPLAVGNQWELVSYNESYNELIIILKITDVVHTDTAYIANQLPHLSKYYYKMRYELIENGNNVEEGSSGEIIKSKYAYYWGDNSFNTIIMKFNFPDGSNNSYHYCTTTSCSNSKEVSIKTNAIETPIGKFKCICYETSDGKAYALSSGVGFVKWYWPSSNREFVLKSFKIN